jgi:hypothetical protein
MKINVLQDGEIKAISFDAWGGLENFLAVSSNGQPSQGARLRQIVPWLNKAIVMTANAVAQLPIEFTRGEVVLDNDSVWGAVESPQTLLYKMVSSLCGGSAYALIEATNRAIISIDYVVPSSIRPLFDASGELLGFERNVSGKVQKLQVEDVLYMWLPDDTVEVGPAQITPLASAVLPASLMAAMDASLQVYGERGFIPPMLLAAKGMSNKADVEKTEKWWNAFLRGWTKTIAKIINAEAVTPTAVGAGMEDMKGSYIEITKQQIENISAAFNIPLSMFLSNSANYATSLSDRRVWYESGLFVTLYQTVEDSLNDQIFSRYGITCHFTPESIDAFQEEEADKSTSLASLSATFDQYPDAAVIAAGVLGYDLTDEQKADILALSEDDEPEPEREVPAVPSQEDNDIAEEITKWRNFASKPRKREFEAKHIPPAIAERIRVGLRNAKTAEEQAQVFDNAFIVAEQPNNDEAVKALAASIERAVASIHE